MWMNSAAFSQGTGTRLRHGTRNGHGPRRRHDGSRHDGQASSRAVGIRAIGSAIGLSAMGGGVPAPYTDVKNPLPANETNINAGKQLFAQNCVSCHGATGKGDGEAGSELTPKPANIAFIMDKWIATDPFLFWSISEGGESLKTSMPAFKETLDDKQRWQIIHYLRTDLGNQN